MDSKLLQRILTYKQRPDIAKPLTVEELTSAFSDIIGLIKATEKAIKESRLKGEDGYTPQPDKDYLSIVTAKTLLQEAVKGKSGELDKAVDKAIQKIDERLAEVRNGLDAEITDEHIKKAAERAVEILNLPNFDEFFSGDRQTIQEIVKRAEELKEEMERVKVQSNQTASAVIARRLSQIRDVDVTGLSDGYALLYNAASKTWKPGAAGGGVSDHGGLSGLSDDDHIQYVAKAGRSGGQTVYGGTGASEDLVLSGTSNATNGSVIVTKNPPSVVSTSYNFSVQDTGNSTWLEMLNGAGADKGAFFGITGSGIDGDSFELWNFQGGSIIFYTAPTATAGSARFTIGNDGTVNVHDNNVTGVGSVGFTQEFDNGSKTASFSVDFTNDQHQKVTLTANTMTLTLDTTSVKVGVYTLKIINGGLATLTWASETGSVTWPGGTAPTLTSSGTDIISCRWDGTNWQLVGSLAFS